MDDAIPDEKEDASLKSRIFLSHALKLINAPLVVDERLELIARIIADYLSVDDVSIFLKEPNADMLVLRISVGLNPLALGNIRVPIGKGITGIVAQTRTYIATKNILKDPRNFYSVYAEDEKYPSLLSFPIVWEEELIGTVNIRSMKERDFTETEAEELNSFTASIAGSIKNAQTYESLEYKSRLLELSINIAGSISSSLDLDTILDEFAWEISKGFGFNGVIVHLFDSQGILHKTASHGLKVSFVNQYPIERVKECLQSNEPKLNRFDTTEISEGTMSGVTWSMSLPLIGQKRTLGVISLFNMEGTFNDPHNLFLKDGIDVLLHISGLAAMTIENALIYSEMKRLSDDEKRKHDEIETLYSRMSAVLDSIDSGIIAVNENGIIQDFNDIARRTLSLTDNARGTVTIDSITAYKPSIQTLISQGKELTNRVVPFNAPSGNFAAMVTMRSFKDTTGEQRGSVLSFRPMEETVKMLSRFSSQRPQFTFDDIIGHSTTLTDTIRLAKIASQSTSNIFIVGESGTGKELFSQAIHNASPVADGPFIPVNCAAIPKDLIESELFGYAEGAFTGARKGGYIGKFEQATGGTIFLDEICDMPLDLQAKLLRVLQEKVIQRVGSEHSIPISTRIIAATNRDLKQMIDTGEFREDLYWRLNVVMIEIPPLRKRKLDINEFVSFFIHKYSKLTGKEIKRAEPAVLKKLMEYSWKGNIRELENTIEHAVLVAQGSMISLNDLPADQMKRIDEEKTVGNGMLEHALKERAESSRRLYHEALVQTHGDIDKAAAHLGMSRATLYRRLKKYNLTRSVSSIKKGIIEEP